MNTSDIALQFLGRDIQLEDFLEDSMNASDVYQFMSPSFGLYEGGSSYK